MPVLKRKLSNPFNMNGNNSNSSTSPPAVLSADTEQLACLLVSPGAVAFERGRKYSAPTSTGTSMATIVESQRRTNRTPRFNFGGGKRSDSPKVERKKKERQASFDQKSKLDK